MKHERSKDRNIDDENTAGRATGVSGQSVSRTPPELRRRRNQRIQDHLKNVLNSSDSLQAVMGPILCDLVETSQNVKGLLDERISHGVAPTAEFKEFIPLLEIYLKSVRQVERLANVECRIRESQTCGLDEQNIRVSAPEAGATDRNLDGAP